MKAELDRLMLHSAEQQSAQLRSQKAEEWTRRGGRLVGVIEDVGDEKVQALVEQALQRGGNAGAEEDGDDDDCSEEDEDYVPIERGSVSPQPVKAQEGHDDQNTSVDEEMVHEDGHRATKEAAVDTDSETESSAPDDIRLRRTRAARPRRAVIGSDDEGGGSGVENATEEDVHPPPLTLTLPELPSPAFPSSGATPWPSRHPEEEKENDPDVSGNDTDKENRAVVCRAPFSSAPQGARVLFDDLLGGSRAVPQPAPLLCEDDPFVFTPSPTKARDDALRRLASPTPARVFGTSAKRGLSQMFEEEDSAAVAQGSNNDTTKGDGDPGLGEFKPALGGLSQAFEETQVCRRLRLIPMLSATTV